MICGTRTRSVLSLALLAALFFFQHGATLLAQADKFREDMQKGDSALNQRNFEAAVTAYKNAVKDARSFTGADLDAASAQANLGLSRAYLGLGAFKNALQSSEDALKHTGTSPVLESMVRNQKGLAIVASVTKPGDPNLEKAVAEFRKVMEITDQDPIVSYNLGIALLKLNKDAEGVHELQAFVARAGNTVEANNAKRMITEPRRARENFAPDFSVTTLDGEFVTLEDLRGKVVLLDFWGTWCPPCRESTPSLVRYSKRHNPEVFTIVGIAVNEPSDQGWRDYVEKNKMAWPQYIDSTRKIAALFKINAFPTYIVVDADGVIRDRRTGWNSETMTSIDDQVKKAMKAREKSGTPVLRTTQERPVTPVATSTTPSNTIPAAPPAATFNPIPVAGIPPVATPAANAPSIPSAGVSVRGHVTRLPGASAALRANLILPGTQPVTTSAVVGPDGSFEFFNVRPGNYNLNLSVPVPFRPIVVGNTDVSGIEFTVPPMRTTQGRISVESAGALPQRVFLQVYHPNGVVNMGMTLQPDGSFNVLLPEGEHRLVVNAQGYLVRAVTYGSSDLLREPLRLTNTENAQLMVTLLANPAGTGPLPFPPAGGPRGGTPPVSAGTEPVLTYQVEPQYTDQARQARLQGAVRLQAIVRSNGTVDSVQVLQGLGMGLDEAAVAAVRQWRFRPATRNGVPVDTTIK